MPSPAAKKYGDIMTWEDSPYAHILTEFGFDTVEVVARGATEISRMDWISRPGTASATRLSPNLRSGIATRDFRSPCFSVCLPGMRAAGKFIPK